MDVSQHAVHVRIIIILTQSNYIEWSVYEASACSTERECGRSSPFSVCIFRHIPRYESDLRLGAVRCSIVYYFFLCVCAENCNFYANFMLTTDHKLLFVEKCSCICYFHGEKKMVSHSSTECWGLHWHRSTFYQ